VHQHLLPKVWKGVADTKTQTRLN